MRCWSSSRPRSSSTAAVWEALWGSTPMVTGMRAPFSRGGQEEPGGQADFGLGQSSVEHSRSGAGRTAQPFSSQLKPEWQRRLWSDLPTPWNLWAAAQSSYPHSISRGASLTSPPRSACCKRNWQRDGRGPAGDQREAGGTGSAVIPLVRWGVVGSCGTGRDAGRTAHDPEVEGSNPSPPPRSTSTFGASLLGGE